MGKKAESEQKIFEAVWRKQDKHQKYSDVEKRLESSDYRNKQGLKF